MRFWSLFNIMWLSLSIAYGGGIHGARATSSVVPVVNDGGWYTSLGIGTLTLRDHDTFEAFTAESLMMVAGYALNKYLSVEGRYTRNLLPVRYHNANRKYHETTQVAFSDLGAYLRLNYPMGNVIPYILGGYGRIRFSKLEKSTRTEKSFRYGLGLRYDVNTHLGFFGEYLHLYRDKGFGHLGYMDSVTIEQTTIGFTYRF